MTTWAGALVATVVIEAAIAVPLLAWLGSPASVVRRVAAVAAASAVTHPLLWLVVDAVGDGERGWTVAVLLGEVVAIAIESLVLIAVLPGERPDRSTLVLVAVVMNGGSTLAGLVVTATG